MVRKALVAAVLAITCISGHAFAKQSDLEKAEAILRRPPETLEPSILVKGDRLDPNITVSTYGVTQVRVKGFVLNYDDESSFLRAFIDRRSGEVTAQIYHVAKHGGDWNFYRTATYSLPDGLKQVETLAAGSDVKCQSWGCSFQEDVIIPIPFAALADKAAHFNPASPFNGIAYRLFGQTGVTIDGVVPENELVAFVHVVERARPALVPGDNAPPPAVLAPARKPERPLSAPLPQPSVQAPIAAPKPRAGNSHVRCITCRD